MSKLKVLYSEKEVQEKILEIAEKLKVTQQCYANYENGTRLPDIEKLIKLADIYETSLDLLTGRYKKDE